MIKMMIDSDDQVQDIKDHQLMIIAIILLLLFLTKV